MGDQTKKILTLSFAIAGFLTGFTIHLLLKAFSGAFAIVARATSSDLVQHVMPVAIGFAVFFALQFNKKVLVWGDEVVSEIAKVVWPTRKDTTGMTVVVCIMVLVSSVVVMGFDFVSASVIGLLVK